MTDPADEIPATPGHAENKWSQRSDTPGTFLSTAWYESVPVGLSDDCPWGPRARLHEPGQAILIYTEADEPNREWVIKTVLHYPLLGGDYPVNDDHLARCDDCGYRYDPSREAFDGCHWCQMGYDPVSGSDGETIAEAP